MTYFLLSNDDGVHAPGITALAVAIAELGPYQVVAPNNNCSGFSHALTLDRPLRPITLPNGDISINGTPADCVHLAINGLLKQDPQMVISGINSGANLGDDVLYSGTVAAAIEGRFLGKPAIAISLVGGGEDKDFTAASQVTRQLLQQWDKIPLPKRHVLNVNIPDLPFSEIKGYQITRLGHRKRSGDVRYWEDPRGQKGYWLGVVGEGDETGPGTDFHAINAGYVSITPLQVDMTCHEVIPEMEQWLQHIRCES